jgi:hypothetical protein
MTDDGHQVMAKAHIAFDKQMNQNLVGSIYGMSSMKIAYFVPICYQTWLPQKLGRNHLWNVLYGDCSFCPDRLISHSETRIACGGHAW